MINDQASPASPFLVSRSTTASRPLKLFRPLLSAGERLCGLRRCQILYDQLDPRIPAWQFPALALEQLAISYRLDAHEQERIPATGSCILIANHPFGGVEGLILMALLRKVRPDFKVMANYLLARVPQLRDHLIEVDPFAGDNAPQTNLVPLRKALNCLRRGELLVIFPAGEVSSPQPGQGVCDPPWSSTLARLVRLSQAPVLPVYFPGRNGPLFQLVGRIHPRLRTFLLPRMLLNKSGKTLELRIGNLLSTKKLRTFPNDQALNDYLRLRTYALELSTPGTRSARTAQAVEPEPLIEELDTLQLKAEIAALPRSQQLLQSGEFDVVYFTADQAPGLLREIGRLRELTFRQAGEGTGRNIDLDSFDRRYLHLSLWNREKNELAGAYRIGRVDELISTGGLEALYTTTLFDFDPRLLERLSPALELGRSFVRPEYQRSYAPLLLLWKGIGHYLTAHPHYRYLFGPVSISNDYSDHSRQLMTSALARNYLLNDLAGLVRSRFPVTLKPLKINGASAFEQDALLGDMDDVSTLIADLEPDNKGIPVLLRQYLNLGGKLLAFNLDTEFADVIDGLLLVDVKHADPRQMQRYMGREGYQNYQKQQEKPACCA